MRAQNSAKVFGAGLFIAGFLAVPILNLLAPLFATALMVHLRKRISMAEQRA
jgi:CysZ protein